ncbi:MAG TPA: sugar ABC transporter permease [Microbacteriaceae bacterium]|nr:sugar ABC transporter permease [Microbacteriaceae bacterium]
MSTTTASRAGTRRHDAPARRGERPRRRHGGIRRFEAALWVGPAVLLIAFVVLWPIVTMFKTAFQKISPYGVTEGPAGWSNFTQLTHLPVFGLVLVNTLVWVVVIVVVTMVLSLGLAQLFNLRFPGRKFTRWALIAPWAASVLMTGIVFKWMLTTGSGLLLMVGHWLGLVSSVSHANPLGQAATSMPWMIAVAVFVSLPFSTYAILAGLTGIPSDIYEAAAVDGASRWKRYWSVTLPLLRPAIVVATLINIMNVFNSFPIIWAMTQGAPNNSTATTTVYMYILKQTNLGQSAALSVVNFVIVIILAVFFLRVSGWKAGQD